MKIIERVFNIETNETIDTERTATPKEVADFKTNELEIAEIAAKIQAKEAAKTALLNRLGITAEEAALLLG